jgi:hypothetical protein
MTGRRENGVNSRAASNFRCLWVTNFLLHGALADGRKAAEESPEPGKIAGFPR